MQTQNPSARGSSGSAHWGFHNEYQDGKGRSGQTLSAVGFSAVMTLAKQERWLLMLPATEGVKQEATSILVGAGRGVSLFLHTLKEI